MLSPELITLDLKSHIEKSGGQLQLAFHRGGVEFWRTSHAPDMSSLESKSKTGHRVFTNWKTGAAVYFDSGVFGRLRTKRWQLGQGTPSVYTTSVSLSGTQRYVCAGRETLKAQSALVTSQRTISPPHSDP